MPALGTLERGTRGGAHGCCHKGKGRAVVNLVAISFASRPLPGLVADVRKDRLRHSRQGAVAPAHSKLQYTGVDPFRQGPMERSVVMHVTVSPTCCLNARE